MPIEIWLAMMLDKRESESELYVLPFADDEDNEDYDFEEDNDY